MLPLSSNGTSRFPKLKECAHFHYDFVDLGSVQLSLDQEHHEFHDSSFAQPATGGGGGGAGVRSMNTGRERSWRLSDSAIGSRFFIRVSSRDKTWVVRQNFEGFCNLDRQLHRCIYDRKYSLLPELEGSHASTKSQQELRQILSLYLKRFSAIACNMINCGPILTWMEMDNRGNHLVAPDNGAINVPAVAAGHVVKRYVAQSLDELSLEVGDIVSIIDMPPANESSWWQGKRKFEVGFFPSKCLQVISGIVPDSVATKLPPKPVLHKRGKLISFLRSFFSSRPTRAQLKQTGIVKERVFGCDLGEHLLNSGHEVPLVLQVCSQAIEAHGIVDGIYRLSGVASNIQKLRNAFDEDRTPELTEDLFVQDVHCISSLLKMYFRELPNPLFTYQLYDKFALAMEDDESKLTSIYDVVQQLPPPHYRTASYLMRHLSRVASHSAKTNMHCKNLAIVWAPNLFRSKELEQIQCSTAVLSGVGIQAIITEYLIMYADVIFSDGAANSGVSTVRHRPKSLMPLPSKLLSLEEAQERAMLKSPKQKYIDVGGGPTALPHDYHTVVDIPKGKKPRKERKPSLSGFKAIFSRSRSGSYRSSCSDRGSINDTQFPEVADRQCRLRMAKSIDVLCYLGRPDAEFTPYSEDEGHTIANPYAEEHWVYVSQAALNGAGGRPRTKSCNSSISDSSDPEEHCSTFIKPLQSSPQNSLKRRARLSDASSSLKTAVLLSKPFEPYGRSLGKENCDVYRTIAHSATSQPKISLANRFNIPPEVPKRSTSLYIDSYDKDMPPNQPDAFLIVSKSLATVDNCPSGTSVNLPLPPPCSFSPNYSSSPSQSDHSDEVFNPGLASCDTEHPLTPICEMLNAGGSEAYSRTWDAASYDAPAMFSLWMDSLYRERAEKADNRSASLHSSVDDASFLIHRDAAPRPEMSSLACDQGLEDRATGADILSREGLEERWEVPTLTSGSAFVTDVDEFLKLQSLNPVISSKFFADSNSLKSYSGLLEGFHSTLPSDSAGHHSLQLQSKSYSRDEEAQKKPVQLHGSLLCLMEYENSSEHDSDTTPTEERLQSVDGNGEAVSFSGNYFGTDFRHMEHPRKDEAEKRGSEVEYSAVRHGSIDLGDADHFETDRKGLEDFEIDFRDRIRVVESGAEQQLDTKALERDYASMECLELDDQKRDHAAAVQTPVKDTTPESRKMEHLFFGDGIGDKYSLSNASDKITSSVESLDLITRPRKMSVVASSADDSCDSDDHIGENETWEAKCHSDGPPLCEETGDYEEETKKVNVSSAISPDGYLFDTGLFILMANSQECHDPRDSSSKSVDCENIAKEVGRNANTFSSLLENVTFPPTAGDNMPSGAPIYKRTESLHDDVAMSTSVTSSSQQLEDLGDNLHRSWVCVAMTGVPTSDSSSKNYTTSITDIKTFPDVSDQFDRGLSHIDDSQESAGGEKCYAEANDANQISWKSSLAGCLRQLCADGYVADRSNSCSPVLIDHSMPSSLSHEHPHEVSNLDRMSAFITKAEDLHEIPKQVSVYEFDFNVETKPSGSEFSKQRSENSFCKHLPDEAGFEPDDGGESETMRKKEESSVEGYSSAGSQRAFCSSESDVYSSASETVQYHSPVRRKSVRELKDRFETAVCDSVPVKAASKKRPPVAKKPSITRPTVLIKSTRTCSSTNALSDSNTSEAAVPGIENVVYSDAISGSLGCMTAPVVTENKFSFADFSSSIECSKDFADEMLNQSCKGRPSSTGSKASCENLSSESQVFDFGPSQDCDRKSKCHSKYGTSVPDVMGVSSSSHESFSGQHFRKSPPSPCQVSEGSAGKGYGEGGPPDLVFVEEIDTKGRERNSAAVASDTKPMASDTKPMASDTTCQKTVEYNVGRQSEEDMITPALGETVCQNPSVVHNIPCERDAQHEECGSSYLFPKTTSQCTGVEEMSVSSCESLSFIEMEVQGTTASSSEEVPMSFDCGGTTSSVEHVLPSKPARFPQVSSVPVKELPIGRVRGLSAMFEQQSLERAEIVQSRRESSRAHQSQDISGRNSQVWKDHHSSSGDGELANKALRNSTIKL